MLGIHCGTASRLPLTEYDSVDLELVDVGVGELCALEPFLDALFEVIRHLELREPWRVAPQHAS